MRVFVSWSGSQSREIAEILRNWLPNILQDLMIYVSSQDIASGERWANSVNQNLEEHQFGISVITEANVSAPWILYEAGALAKSLGGSRLIPVLCGIESITISNHPLSQFQYVVAPAEGELFRLVGSLNAQKENPLHDQRLKDAFTKWYPDFAEAYKMVDLEPKSAQQAPATSAGDLLPVLETVMREIRDLRGEMILLGGSHHGTLDTTTAVGLGANSALAAARNEAARRFVKFSDLQRYQQQRRTLAETFRTAGSPHELTILDDRPNDHDPKTGAE